MEKFLKNTPVETFPIPEGIVFVKVDPKTGARVKGAEKGSIYECFLDSAQPDEKTDDMSEEKEDLFR
jgi:penicillin-binding protein 1A